MPQGKRHPLGRTAVLASSAPESFVQFGVEELRRYLRRAGDATAEPSIPDANTIICIGLEAARQMSAQLAQDLSAAIATLTADGYAIIPARRNQQTLIAISGKTPHGTRSGLLAFLRSLSSVPRTPNTENRKSQTAPRVVSSPRWATRGMYAHTHWAYARPYATRSWTVDDWKRYIDLLAFFGCNRLQIWAMVDAMPYPLPAGDRRYLERVREAVAYAKQARGFEVSVSGCANTVGREEFASVPIEKRDYFRAEKRVNPARRADMDYLLKQREQFYRIVDNADAHWIIDSDPGGYAGSTVDEFVNIFVQHRRVLDKLGRSTRLEYWMWSGWNNAATWYGAQKAADPGWKETLEKLKQRLGEPWGILACPYNHPGHKDVVESLGLVEKSLVYSYAAVEPEPSHPFTMPTWPAVERTFVQGLAAEGYRGVQCNAQTPWVQLPNFYHFQRLAWEGLDCRTGIPSRTDPRRDSRPTERRTPEQSLAELAALIAAESAADLAAGWAALAAAKPDPKTCHRLSARLANAAPLTRPISPIGLADSDAKRILTDLSLQLAVLGCEEEAIAALASGRAASVRRAASAYLATSSAWWSRHRYLEPLCWRPWYLPLMCRRNSNPRGRLNQAFASFGWRAGEQAVERVRQAVAADLKRQGLPAHQASALWSTFTGATPLVLLKNP